MIASFKIHTYLLFMIIVSSHSALRNLYTGNNAVK
jgi:hypothetical protein